MTATEAPDLDAPITVAEFWANRRGESAPRATHPNRKVSRCIDVRRFSRQSPANCSRTHKGQKNAYAQIRQSYKLPPAKSSRQRAATSTKAQKKFDNGAR